MTTEREATTVPDAWVAMPEEATVRAYMGSGHPYDFGFIPGMARLITAHPGIGAHFGMLFRQIMFEPGAMSRDEREMVAAVASAAQDCHY
jgi:alkylhydroperoxidase/carboxymuconolactone decarboxylase family protein YurZ